MEFFGMLRVETLVLLSHICHIGHLGDFVQSSAEKHQTPIGDADDEHEHDDIDESGSSASSEDERPSSPPPRRPLYQPLVRPPSRSTPPPKNADESVTGTDEYIPSQFLLTGRGPAESDTDMALPSIAPLKRKSSPTKNGTSPSKRLRASPAPNGEKSCTR